MEKKVIDLEIVDDLQESGVDAIALVDQPAIEKNWLFFSKQNFVEPKPNESKDDYMGRCVPYVMDEGKAQDQAIAQCISTYENMSQYFRHDAFADYPWDECIADRLAEGKGEEAAKNICGWIRAQNMSTEEFAKVSFDFDDTLSTAAGLELAQNYKQKGDTLYIISARNEVSSDMLDRAKELGIPESRVYATGSNKAKIEKVLELNIDKHIDNNADVIKELGGKGEKFEISTGGLAPYTQQTGPVKKKDQADFSKALEFAKTAGFSASDFNTNGMEFNEIPEGFDLELAKGYTVYKYTGSVGSDTRDFCREMVNMDRFYTFEEIDAMGTQVVNPGFGLKGADTYDIWKYKGGPNCKHRWTKFYVTAEGTFQNKGKAPGIAGEKPNDMPNHGYAFAAVEDKMELVGPVAIPDIEIPRRNEKTKEIFFVRFSKDVVRRMAEKFLGEKRIDSTNIQHIDTMDGGTHIVESWIVENPEDKANAVYGLDVPVGTWMVRCKVDNPQTWEKVKKGEVQGFSLQGNFLTQAEYESYMKEKKMYEDLVRLVNSF